VTHEKGSFSVLLKNRNVTAKLMNRKTVSAMLLFLLYPSLGGGWGADLSNLMY
jgi:hypothetical protein